MHTTKRRRRAWLSKLRVIATVGAAAVLSAAVVAVTRRRSRRTPPAEGEGTLSRRGEAIEIQLIGHEFSFSGERFRILKSARDTEDGLLQMEYFAPPRTNIREHTHRHQEEQYEVISGALGIRVGGQESILVPGQSAVGPAGVPHSWWNPSNDKEGCYLFGIRPGLDVETWLETMLGLARDGKSIGMIPKNPLQLAVLIDEVGSWLVLTPPVKVLLAPVALLAFVGKLLGYRARYPEYSGPDAADALGL
jgi:quercetin dioxygenase-like cupin family protein